MIFISIFYDYNGVLDIYLTHMVSPEIRFKLNRVSKHAIKIKKVSVADNYKLYPFL